MAQIDRPILDQTHAIDGTRESVGEFVSRVAWNEKGWRRTLAHLAGLMKKPELLIDELIGGPGGDGAPTTLNPLGDDNDRHRLGMAAYCAARVGSGRNRREAEVRATLRDQVFRLCWPLLTQGEAKAAIQTGAGALATWHPRLNDQERSCHETLLEALTDEPLRAEPFEVTVSDLDRWRATTAIHRLGSAVATEPFLARLAGLLGHRDPYIRATAACAVEDLGPSTASKPEFLARLPELLADSNADVQVTATRLVGSIGPAAATEHILARLADLLARRGGYSVGSRIWEMGLTAATSKDLLASLARVFHTSEPGLRASAAYAVALLGPAAAKSKFLSRLASLLGDTDPELCWPTAYAVASIGPNAASNEDILARLTDLLKNRAWYVSCSAADAMRSLGPAAKLSTLRTRLDDLRAIRDLGVRFDADFMAACLDPVTTARGELQAVIACLLVHRNADVRVLAADLLGIVGAVAATDANLILLAELLTDKHADVRWHAADAVGNLGAVAAIGRILSHLADLLADDDADVACRAAVAIGNLGAAAATETVLSRLLLQYSNGDRERRSTAAYALAKLTPAAACNGEILAHLALELEFGYPDSAWTASELVGKFGPAAATNKPFLARLTNLLRHPRADARGRAAQAIRSLGPAAVAEESLAGLTDLLHDSEREVRSEAASTIISLRPHALRGPAVQAAWPADIAPPEGWRMRRKSVPPDWFASVEDLAAGAWPRV